MARKAPAFQLYVDDFLAGTITFTAEEVGIYIRLLCFQWSTGGVTARHIAASGGSEEATKYVLSEKFTETEGVYRNARLEFVRNLSETRSDAASRGGSIAQANRKQNVSKTSSKTQANGQANGQAKSNTPTPTPTPTPFPITDRQTDCADAVGQSVGRVLEFDFSVEQIEESMKRFRKISGCTRSTLPPTDAASVVAFGLAVGDGFASELGERLRNGDIRRPKGYCAGAIKNACTDKGIDYAASRINLIAFVERIAEESKTTNKDNQK